MWPETWSRGVARTALRRSQGLVSDPIVVRTATSGEDEANGSYTTCAGVARPHRPGIEESLGGRQFPGGQLA
jgi:hypothetical protein